MHCPQCRDVHLSIAERRGIEIDYCPRCRGVWLDRGELDKLIEQREHPRHEARIVEPAHPPPRNPGRDPGHDPARSRRKGFLSEIFDFD